MVAAKGKRTKYRCAACGYGIVVYERPPSCPMCRKPRWEHVESRLSSPLLDALALPFGTESQRRSFHAPSLPTAEKSVRYVRPGQAGASLEKMTPAEELEQLGSAL
jgi:rubredoxin